MKKTILVALLAVTPLFAADPLHSGKPYTPKVDGVFLSMNELNALKDRVDAAEREASVNKAYAQVVEDYKHIKELQEQLVGQYQQLDKLKQDSINIYKEAVVSYKGIIDEERKNAMFFQNQLSSQKRQTRFQRNMAYVLGFISPVIGARAFNWVK